MYRQKANPNQRLKPNIPIAKRFFVALFILGFLISFLTS